MLNKKIVESSYKERHNVFIFFIFKQESSGMVINISPNRINTQSGTSGKAARFEPRPDSGNIIVPSKAHVNNIPAPESLQTMIRSAVASLNKGVFWDRGTILNLVV
jgi:hypothetical protein